MLENKLHVWLQPRVHNYYELLLQLIINITDCQVKNWHMAFYLPFFPLQNFLHYDINDVMMFNVVEATVCTMFFIATKWPI